MNQCERILKYLDDFGGISTRDAFVDLGIASLSRRICDLKRRGYIINGEYRSEKNRYGEWASFKRYSIDPSTDVKLVTGQHHD